MIPYPRALGATHAMAGWMRRAWEALGGASIRARDRRSVASSVGSRPPARPKGAYAGWPPPILGRPRSATRLLIARIVPCVTPAAWAISRMERPRRIALAIAR
jgi:hypothetical protein